MISRWISGTRHSSPQSGARRYRGGVSEMKRSTGRSGRRRSSTSMMKSSYSSRCSKRWIPRPIALQPALCQRRVAHELELVELYGREGKLVDLPHGIRLPLPPGKPEEKMRGGVKPPPGRTLDRVPGRGVVVPPVYLRQNIVVDAFHAVLDADEMRAGQGGEKIEHGLVHAVGAGAYHQAGDGGMGQDPGIEIPEVIGIAVSIGIGLEVGDESGTAGIAFAQEPDPFLDLHVDVRVVGIKRDEGFVVAESAASGAHPPVAVGASKSPGERHFLHAPAETLLEPFGRAVVRKGIAPGKALGNHLRMAVLQTVRTRHAPPKPPPRHTGPPSRCAAAPAPAKPAHTPP